MNCRTEDNQAHWFPLIYLLPRDSCPASIPGNVNIPPFCFSKSVDSWPQLVHLPDSITCREARSTRPLRHAPKTQISRGPSIGTEPTTAVIPLRLQCERKLHPVASRVDLGRIPFKQNNADQSSLHRLSPPTLLRTACIHSDEVRR